MGESKKESSQVFDVDRIKQLVEMMKSNDLSEVSLCSGTDKIRLRRGATETQIVMAPQPSYAAPYPAPVAAPAPAVAAAPAASTAPAAPAVDGPNIVVIKSPMVGTFYAKPNPNSPAYVQVGDHVTADKTVCTIEAMKMFTPIPAGVSGKVVAVLAKNEEAVDVNKPLFKVDTGA